MNSLQERYGEDFCKQEMSNGPSREHDILELIYIGKKHVNRGNGRNEYQHLFLVRKT